MEWQPIDTAPKGETRTVVAGKGTREIHVSPRILTFTSAGDLTITFWNNGENRWNMFSKNTPPTHWMPLPAIPEMEGSK